MSDSLIIEEYEPPYSDESLSEREERLDREAIEAEGAYQDALMREE